MSNSGQNSYMPDFFLIDLFLQKRFANLFELLTGCQKMTFWRPLWRFSVRSRAAETYCRPPPLPLSFTVYTDHPRAGEVPPAVVRCTAQRQSTFQPVSGRGLHRVWGVAGSQSGLLSLYFLQYSWRAPFWADFHNRSALWHTTQRPREVSLYLVKARSKLNGPRYLTYFPNPG